MESATWPLLGTDAATAFLADLRAADQPSEVLSAALRGAIGAGMDLDVVEAGRALAAVAVLLAEHEPAVLDGAADTTAARELVARLDTELTPARRQAGRAVVDRVLVDQANSWYATRSAQDDWPQIKAQVEHFADLLAQG